MDNLPTQTVPEQVSEVPQSHKKLLYGAVGFSALAVVLLGVVALKMTRPTSLPVDTTTPTMMQQDQGSTSQPTTLPSTASDQTMPQQAVVTPTPVNTKQDVSSALQQIDSTDPSVVTSDLNKNTSDTSQFSQ